MKIILACLALAASLAVASAAPPNIVFIMTDQHSADALSCRMGDRYLKTPALDRLAARGTFSRAPILPTRSACPRATRSSPVAIRTRPASPTTPRPRSMPPSSSRWAPTSAKPATGPPTSANGISPTTRVQPSHTALKRSKPATSTPRTPCSPRNSLGRNTTSRSSSSSAFSIRTTSANSRAARN